MRAYSRVIWGLARHDLILWWRSPWAMAGALLPPLGMALLLWMLTAAVGQQPVGLVVESHGPRASALADAFRDDKDAYLLSTLSMPVARQQLADQRITAIIRIPSDFDRRMQRGSGVVDLIINNIDLDFTDDLRRTVTRTVAAFDAISVRATQDRDLQPTVYPVLVDEHDRRATTVEFDRYQLVSVLILIVINIGVLGTALLCAREFEGRTAKVLLNAPVPAIVVVVGKVVGGFLATWMLLAPVIAIGALLGLIAPPSSHWPALLAVLACTSVLATGLGLSLGMALRRTGLIAMCGLNLAIGLYFLGGGFTTIAFLPPWLEELTRVVPTRYAIEALRQTLFYPDLEGVGRALLILLASGALFIALGSLSMIRGLRRA